MAIQGWLSKLSNGTVIGALFGSSIYFYRTEFARFDDSFRQAHFFRFIAILMGMATTGALLEVIREWLTSNSSCSIKSVRYTDESVIIEEEDGKTIEIIKEKTKLPNKIINSVVDRVSKN